MSIVNYVKFKDLNIVFDTNIEEKFISCDPEKIKPLKSNTKISFKSNLNENSRIEVIKVEFSDIYRSSR